jgi:hypothetical protein
MRATNARLLAQIENSIEVIGDNKPIVGVYTAFHRRSAPKFPRITAAASSESNVKNYLECIMNKQILAAVLVAATATLAAPAFASGYGPAPSYRPNVGAPASQQGVNTQTIAAERAAANANVDAKAYGGSTTLSQSGNRAQPIDNHSVYFGH